MVYLNHFDPILTLADWNFEKKLKKCFYFFLSKTDKLSKHFLFFRKLTQIAVISMVLELNYHKKSRYIEFNFDPKNNYFRLKSEIFIKMGSKLGILVFYPIRLLEFKPTENYHFGRYYITRGMKTHLLYLNFLFFIKKVSLSVSHQYTRF